MAALVFGLAIMTQKSVLPRSFFGFLAIEFLVCPILVVNILKKLVHARVGPLNLEGVLCGAVNCEQISEQISQAIDERTQPS